jgi:hypothetical protein
MKECERTKSKIKKRKQTNRKMGISEMSNDDRTKPVQQVTAWVQIYFSLKGTPFLGKWLVNLMPTRWIIKSRDIYRQLKYL